MPTIDGRDDDDEALLRSINVRSASAVSLAGPVIKAVSTEQMEGLIKLYGAAVEIAIQKAIFKLAKETRDRMRRDAPKRTGALAASIYVSEAPGANQQVPGVNPANVKKSTVGYFKAIQAATKLSAPKGWAGTSATRAQSSIARLQIQTSAMDNVHTRTQSSSKFSAAPASLIGSKIRVNAYNEFASEEGGSEIGNFLPMAVGGRNSFYITIGVAVFYAGLVEFGTVHARAQPFFVPNMEWARSQALGRVKNAIDSVQVNK